MTSEAKREMVLLRSAEGSEFFLPIEAAEVAELVRDSLDENEDDDDDDQRNKEQREVDVIRVSCDCLAKVVDFLKHHDEEPMTEIPTPLGGNSFEEVMPQQWYQNFVADDNMSQEMLFELLTAANYMGIKPLLDLACLKVTFQLNGKSAEEIRLILNLPELTPEEERLAREEHRWIFEDNYP
ncbi:ubiquitin ligase complex SCF subunit sconC [Seminavis robusta]|uniref:Ubiquitin ligase complex SCF subunit sconC n=1 Tax=Seminavis robusta TaxID=568900 RepID=A0A9N8DF41_9STRA|nr:ubiquitin ligase complex SCF subunit sconC [Seminavis robusta]|eukprot:Sro119_g058220.1 ubiquitin ligase complex SCF subunit sconC (182) ;mRNA; r:91756-92410